MSKRGKKVKIKKILEDSPERYLNIDPLNCSIKQFEQLIPDTVPQIVKEDIAHYFNYLRNNRNQESLKLWEKVSGCTDSPNSWKVEGYRPIFSFLYYDRITDGLFLALLLNRIEPISNEKIQTMTIEEFNRQCRLTIISFKPEIDEIDLKILKALSKDPSLVIQELTEEIGHSYAAVYRHLQKLKAKLGLRILTRINWTKLGIQPLFLITKDKTDFDFFTDFKTYLDGQATFLWGKAYHLRYYFVTETARTELLQKYQEVSKKKKSFLELMKLTSAPMIGWTFDFFNKNEQRWEIDFIKTYRYLAASKKQKVHVKELFHEEYPPKEVYSLTPLETKIIDDLVGKYNLTQKELAKHLGMHAQNLSTIKLKLLEDEIIYPRFEMRNFLPIGCVLWCSSSNQKIFETVIPLLQKLPFSNISPVRNYREPKKLQLFSFLFLDDILYRNLVVFLMKLLREKQIDDFQLGVNVESYFGMAKVANILPKS